MNLCRSWGKIVLTCFLLSALIAPALPAEGQKDTGSMRVSAGKLVSLEYTLILDDKTVVESNVGTEPMKYTHGSHDLIPGLEKELEGMAVGDRKQVTVKPENGYGAVDPQALQEVQKTLIPADALTVGVQLRARGPDGSQSFPRVVEVKNDSVVLDFDHPLAGKRLHFEVKVLEIKPGEAQKKIERD